MTGRLKRRIDDLLFENSQSKAKVSALDMAVAGLDNGPGNEQKGHVVVAETWCRGRNSNPHGAFAPEDFKGCPPMTVAMLIYDSRCLS
jgi:hypothetical protein